MIIDIIIEIRKIGLGSIWISYINWVLISYYFSGGHYLSS